MKMTIVSQLLRTIIGIINYVSSTSFLNQPFVYRAIFSTFVSAVCTKPTLTQQSEASTTQCKCPQLDTKASQFHHNNLITWRLSYSHIVCLSRDFSANI